MNFKQILKVTQPKMIAVFIALTLAICAAILLSATKTSEGAHEEEHETHGEHEADDKADEGHEHEEEKITLTAQQLAEQGLKIGTVAAGPVDQVTALSGKLVVNTDQQAHVSPNFSGHVEQVNVALGQTVTKGQPLAVLSVPELIDQQANLRIAQENLNLAQQDYLREKQLWSQGISAKQDYQRAENYYRQAQISIQAAQSRLNALGASAGNNGRFIIRAPMSGVISQKDIVVGENVQLADQLFVIEQLKELWLEFNLPQQLAGQLQAEQLIHFRVNGATQDYTAQVQSLTSQADVQTGRLVVRAKLLSQAKELRPNVLVNVLIVQPAAKNALRIMRSAVQDIDSKKTVFLIASEQKGQIQLKPQQVEIGQSSSDGEWLEVLSGLSSGQKYISQGSFLLKSELEKDEAGHEH
ncbi:efflux RND transporter periplasmic adaptor subunit [Acinetobacter pragensis]|uniref:Efflux transporter periplasmic adaptor subunit n=1 Tax=Acinetobacter pragensis TaxID=1806892 RepID=A0A151Y2W9_9GAMM|nr:efflux RND transporter periplasmic adaptor subunit [Acinetobacter pragensis]KYQ72365.1 efflux transporter periplasmic adaptor subunit [Acinetobacter pragensis]